MTHIVELKEIYLTHGFRIKPTYRITCSLYQLLKHLTFMWLYFHFSYNSDYIEGVIFRSVLNVIVYKYIVGYLTSNNSSKS